MKVSVTSVSESIARLVRYHRLAIWLVQGSIFALSGAVAFWLRFEGDIPQVNRIHLLWGLLVWVASKSVIFRLCGLDRGWWRFVSIHDVVRIWVGNAAGCVVAFAVIRWFGPPGFPRSIYILDFVVCFLATAGVRIMIRLVREAWGQQRPSAAAIRTLIY
jgi:FlaA1/EpsC-like NDP-sugar epimerase